jgi:excisionase family DNA binding protein
MKRCLTAALVFACMRAAAGEAQDVLTVEEAARLLRVPQEKVLAMAKGRRIPARDIDGEWRLSRSALLEWLKGRDDALSPAELPAVTGRGSARVDSPEQVAQAAQPAQPPASIGEKRATPTAEEVSLRDQGALLKGGARTIEVGFAYARSERETFPVARTEQRLFAGILTGRYGLKDDLQATARLPWNYRQSRTQVAPAAADIQTDTANDRYAGDLSLSLLGVGMREAMGRPNVIWSVDSVLPVGPGDRGLGAGVIVSKSYDPVVLFGGARYMRGYSIDEGATRRLLAKNNWRLTLGYAYAVNDNLALNGSLASAYRSPLDAPVGTLPEARERHQLQFGMTWMLERGLYIEPAVAFGIGGAAPDLTVSLNIPYTF